MGLSVPENIVIATPVLSDAAVLTAGSEAADMPAANLLTQQPIDVWRATDLANAYLVADLGAAAAINLVALLYTNASSAAQWRVRAAASEADLTAAPGYDSGLVDMWPHAGLETWDWTHAFRWLGVAGATPGPQTFRWWRIDVADPGNAAGYVQAGRLYLAAAWQPTRNLLYGWSVGFIDFSAKVRAAGGQILPGSRPLHRVARFALRCDSESEMYDNAFEIDRRRGTSGDVLVLRDPATPSRLMKQSVYGTLSSLEPIVNARFNVFEKPYEIEEMIP